MAKFSKPPVSLPTLGFIGAGNMAQAIARGVIESELYQPKQIIVSAPSDKNLVGFAKMGCRITHDNTDVLAKSDIVIIACKPQIFPLVAPQLAAKLRPSTLLISVMAGLSTAKIRAAIAPSDVRIVRAMPNTPLAVGYGVTALCAGAEVNEDSMDTAMEIFAAAGTILPLSEDKMDAFTAVCGSGPAYLFYIAEAMEKAALDFGLPAEACRAMVVETLMGSVALLSQEEDAYSDPAELRRQVTSPGGCTAEAIGVFDAAKMKETIVAALKANVAKSRALRGE